VGKNQLALWRVQPTPRPWVGWLPGEHGAELLASDRLLTMLLTRSPANHATRHRHPGPVIQSS
jgi:hypothetical protein